MKPPQSFDFLGNIALVKFPREFKQSDRKRYARELMSKNKSITTVLEKVGKISGRLRTPTTKWLAGKKTKEVLYRENGCVFRFNIDSTYFSPRLSNERKEIASKIKKDEKVLVMFAGVSPFPIVIAKNSDAEKVYSNEINREANKYGQLNIELNKVKNKVELLPGDIKRVAERIDLLASLKIPPPSPTPPTRMKAVNQTLSLSDSLLLKFNKSDEQKRGAKFSPKFDVIVMPRPQLKDSFLKQAFQLSKKGTRIFYYDFCGVNEVQNIVEKIKAEALQAKKKIQIIKIKKAGEIAPYKIRLRVDFKLV